MVGFVFAEPNREGASPLPISTSSSYRRESHHWHLSFNIEYLWNGNVFAAPIVRLGHGIHVTRLLACRLLYLKVKKKIGMQLDIVAK